MCDAGLPLHQLLHTVLLLVLLPELLPHVELLLAPVLRFELLPQESLSPSPDYKRFGCLSDS